MDAHLPNVFFNLCSTPKTRDIKWTHICHVFFNQCSTPKTRDIKWTHICLMSTLINALPRKLVILNGRTFAESTLICHTPDVILNGRRFA